MSRPRTGNELSVAQLEQMLSQRRSRITVLQRQRAKLQRKLDVVDEQIGDLGGNGRGRPGGRVRNAKSLIETLAAVLKDAGEAMRVADLAEAVLRTGYKTNSANFRGIVNQTLIKDKRFVPIVRGSYQLKK